MNSSAPADPAVAAAVDGALGGLRAHQVDMTRLFSVGVDILNASRALDSMAFELQLLARNGVVQAAQMNHASGGSGAGSGQSLLALAEILSNCPREIAPSLAELGERCRDIATHTAHCMSLARRHAQHLKALLLVLSQESGAAGGAELLGQLAASPLHTSAAPGQLMGLAERWSLTPALHANLALIAERCTAAVREQAQHLAATASCLRATDAVLHAIGRVGGTVNYLGINVAIEAAHCDARGANFRQLAVDIDGTVRGLEQKLGAIRHSAERGRSLIRALGA